MWRGSGDGGLYLELAYTGRSLVFEVAFPLSSPGHELPMWWAR